MDASTSARVAEEEIDYEGLGDAVPLHINMIAGALAGISEHAVMFPVDVVRTRMQVLAASPAASYSGVAEAFSRISTVEGSRALWRGVTSVILGAGPAHALYFGTYEVVKEMTGGNNEGHQFASTAFAGASATIMSDAFMNPFDGELRLAPDVTFVLLISCLFPTLVIKQRMQVHGSIHRSVFRCASSVYRQEGLRAFYVSYPTTLTMTVPFTAVQFSVYEWAKKVLNPSDTYSPTTHAIAGGFSGAVAAAVTNPLDVAKTLLQTRGTSTDAQIRNASGMFEAFRIIRQREGMKGFARGLTPRVLTFMPSNALCWLVSRTRQTVRSEGALLTILVRPCDSRTKDSASSSTSATSSFEQRAPAHLCLSRDDMHCLPRNAKQISTILLPSSHSSISVSSSANSLPSGVPCVPLYSRREWGVDIQH